MTAGCRRTLTPPPQLSTTTPVWGAVVLTGGVPKRYITHFDIAEILAAASRVGLADFGSGAAEPPARC
jgi:hypothetical protein